MTWRVLLGIDALVAAVLAWFFLVGLADGSVSSFNLGLWIGLLSAVAGVIAGGVALRRSGRPRLASALLGVVAAPGLLYGLFLLLILVTQSRWN